jgi:hypothetical protein
MDIWGPVENPMKFSYNSDTILIEIGWREVKMITISTSLLSGQGIQQRYSVARITGDKSSRAPTRAIATPDGDTVQISPEARALFRAWSLSGTDEARPPVPTEQNARGEADETSGSRINTQEQITQLKTDIDDIEVEIAELEKASKTDEVAAAILVRKRTRLQTLQAALTGLFAKSFQIA